MDNPLVMQIVLGLLVLMALVFGGLSIKTWRAWDVVGGFFVFLGAVSFLVLLSVSLKARRHWLKTLDQHQTENSRLLAEQERLLYGDLADVTQSEDSLRGVTAKLSRFLVDRGRVWRDCVPSPLGGDGTITVTVTGAAAGDPHPIPPNFILHVYRELPAADNVVLPAFYIGEFQVVSADETTVKLKPTLLSPSLLVGTRAQGAEFQNNFAATMIENATWALYEMLPPDGHRAFNDPDDLADLSVEGEPIFGEVQEAQIRQTFQQVLQNPFASIQPPSPQQLEALISQYLRDGKRAEASDPQDQVHLKVEFLKDHTEKVDTDVAQDILSETFFDSQGQAQVDFLRRGDDGTVTLKTGAVVVLPQEQANQLIRDGVCKLVEPIYVRQLTDFSKALHTQFDRWVDTQKKIAATNYNNQQMTAANQLTNQMIQTRQDERTKLESDLQYMTYERDQLAALREALEAQLAQLRDEIRGLLATNLALEQDLETTQQRISDQVDRAVEQAVSAAAP